MKKVLALILAAILAASALASCATAPTDQLLTPHSSLLTSSSSGYADEAWLTASLGDVPANTRVGLASELGLDMSAFEDDGYVIRDLGGETVVCAKTADGLDRAVRRFARLYKSGEADGVDIAYHEGARIERLTVAGRDIADFTVVYTPGEKPVQPRFGITYGNAEYAAGEFVRLIKIATGITLPMSDKETPSPMIRIDAIYENSPFGDNGFNYRVKDGNVYITGCGLANGCALAVYHLLENHAGWCDLTFGDSLLTEADAVDIPEGIDVTRDPAFDFLELQGYMDSFYRNPGVDYKLVSDAPTVGTSVNSGLIPKCCHGQMSNKWGGFDAGDSNFCYSDEGNLNGVYDDISYYLETHLAAGEEVLYVDMGQGDNLGFCHCKNCNKVIAQENASNAGPIVRGANQIAEWLEPDFPDVKLLNFAYHGSNNPPKTAPHDNVWFTFCFDGACCYHALASGECSEYTFDFVGVMGEGKEFNNADYYEWLKGWCALSPNVYIWYYKLDGVFHQYTLLSILYEDIKTFREMGIKGMMFNGDYYGIGTGGFDHEMLYALQTDPDMTETEYIDRLAGKVERKYGRGSWEYFRELVQYLETANLHGGCTSCWGYMDVLDPNAVDYAYLSENRTRILELCDGLIECAESAKQQADAERFTLCFIYEAIPYAYLKASDEGDAAAMAELEAMFNIWEDRMTRVGYNFDDTVLGAGVDHRFCHTIAEEAAQNWEKYRESLFS